MSRQPNIDGPTWMLLGHANVDSGQLLITDQHINAAIGNVNANAVAIFHKRNWSTVCCFWCDVTDAESPRAEGQVQRIQRMPGRRAAHRGHQILAGLPGLGGKGGIKLERRCTQLGNADKATTSDGGLAGKVHVHRILHLTGRNVLHGVVLVHAKEVLVPKAVRLVIVLGVDAVAFHDLVLVLVLDHHDARATRATGTASATRLK